MCGSPLSLSACASVSTLRRSSGGRSNPGLASMPDPLLITILLLVVVFYSPDLFSSTKQREAQSLRRMPTPCPRFYKKLRTITASAPVGSILGRTPNAPKIAVSHFGIDPSNHRSPNDLQSAHANPDLHRVVAYKWSYVEHRKVRRSERSRAAGHPTRVHFPQSQGRSRARQVAFWVRCRATFERFLRRISPISNRFCPTNRN